MTELSTVSRGSSAARILIVDDLVDTGKTAGVVRSILPRAHFATVYAKPAGRPMVDTFVTEVSQDAWIYLPWDMSLQFTPPIRECTLRPRSVAGTLIAASAPAGRMVTAVVSSPGTV